MGGDDDSGDGRHSGGNGRGVWRATALWISFFLFSSPILFSLFSLVDSVFAHFLLCLFALSCFSAASISRPFLFTIHFFCSSEPIIESQGSNPIPLYLVALESRLQTQRGHHSCIRDSHAHCRAKTGNNTAVARLALKFNISDCRSPGPANSRMEVAWRRLQTFCLAAWSPSPPSPLPYPHPLSRTTAPGHRSFLAELITLARLQRTPDWRFRAPNPSSRNHGRGKAHRHDVLKRQRAAQTGQLSSLLREIATLPAALPPRRLELPGRLRRGDQRLNV